VRPGDVLCARTQTLEKIDLRSRPEAGIVKFATSLFNQAGKEVMSQRGGMLFARRRPLAELPPATVRPAAAPLPDPIDDAEGAVPDRYSRARVGARAELGESHFTPEYIRSYSAKFDPLPFHMDEAAGRAHPLGAMSAAGLQTACSWMSHFIAMRRRSSGGGELPSLASPGFSDMLWRKPVLVGDRIRFSTQLVEKRLTSKPNLGLLRSRNLGINQRGEIALEFYAAIFAPIEA
jgi:acyl dehydratase